jgi:hypothetical protein
VLIAESAHEITAAVQAKVFVQIVVRKFHASGLAEVASQQAQVDAGARREALERLDDTRQYESIAVCKRRGQSLQKVLGVPKKVFNGIFQSQPAKMIGDDRPIGPPGIIDFSRRFPRFGSSRNHLLHRLLPRSIREHQRPVDIKEYYVHTTILKQFAQIHSHIVTDRAANRKRNYR